MEQVESIGIQTDELAVVKDALTSTHKWIQRVNDLTMKAKATGDVGDSKQEKMSSGGRGLEDV